MLTRHPFETMEVDGAGERVPESPVLSSAVALPCSEAGIDGLLAETAPSDGSGVEPEASTEVIKPVRRPFARDAAARRGRARGAVQDMTGACLACGGTRRRLGEDVAELLDYVPGSFRVIQHVRPKLSCRSCETITQVPAASLPIRRGRAGPGLLAHVLVAKYCDHLSLHRQAEIYAREDVDLSRSTLADMAGQTARLIRPLIDALDRIAALYRIEDTICGRLPDQRLRVRTEQMAPLMAELRDWLDATRYALSRWTALTLILRGGRGCTDNSAAERAMRPIAVGRRN